MHVAKGENRRKREAVEGLVADVARGAEADIVYTSLHIALERGWVQSFRDILVDTDKKKNSEIDRICARNYQGFIESVEEILQMRGSASKVTSLVQDIHSDVQSNGGDLIKVLKELERIQFERNHTNIALDAALQCKQLITLVLLAQQQISNHDHYGALRTIQKIQSEKSNVSIYAFSRNLDRWLSELIESLILATQIEVNEWQVQLKGKCYLLGSTLSRNYIQLKNEYNTMLASKSTLSCLAILKNAKIFRLHMWNKGDSLEAFIPHDFHALPSQEGLQLIDDLPDQFSAIHKALYINSIIGDVRAFHIRAHDARSRILSSFIEHAAQMIDAKGFCPVMLNMLHQVCGFFVAECISRQMMDSDEEFSSNSELYQLWESTCSSIYKLCLAKSQSITRLHDLHHFKEYLLLLIDTMSDEAFGLKADPMLNVMSCFLPRFKQLLQSNFISNLRSILGAASHQPLFVSTAEQFESQVKAFRLDTLESTLNSTVAGAGMPHHRIQSAAARLDELEEDLDTNVLPTSSRTSFTGQSFPFSQTVSSVMRCLYDMAVHLFLFGVRNDNILNRGEMIVNVALEAVLAVAKELYSDLLAEGAGAPLVFFNLLHKHHPQFFS